MEGLELFAPGVQAWFPDKEEGWVTGQLRVRHVEGAETILTFDDENDKERIVKVKATSKNLSAQLPPLRNPPLLEGTDDLTNLSFLNEPSVLQNIKIRYAQQNIYTYSGIVLIAMNPFQKIPIYTPDLALTYSGKRRGDLEPHLFAIAEEAYRGMLTDKRNQTVVVSGESGAGKTVSAKFIMRYFAIAGEAASGSSADSQSEVEERIMATNPILESFGNAKTTRNDNSSRFGKYIELHFGPNNQIFGAVIRTYLLERSRLIFQPEIERNYHIFYQLCAGAPPSERSQLQLTNSYADYQYLSQGGVGEINGVDDAAEFATTQQALSRIGISVSQQWDIFRILAGLLHLGNVEIKAQGKTAATISDEGNDTLAIAAGLIGLDIPTLSKWVLNKQITTRSEKIITRLTAPQSIGMRDAVAKFIYTALFDWLVASINEVLYDKEAGFKEHNFIGVLDIYGFEHFKINSFEQFCINFANEKLQQEFNRRVFKLEQEEYIAEEIQWSFIDFADNQPCIDMIEGRMGILSLLDEESRLPSGTDQNFVEKLHQNFDAPKYEQYYKKPRFGNSAFVVCHFAHDVSYESEGFLDKNRDNVPEELMSVLEATTMPFLAQVLEKRSEVERLARDRNMSITPASGSGAGSKRMSMASGSSAVAKKSTLGSVFKSSLIELMSTINSTNVHYIRCIKPNEAKEAWGFDPNMVLSQLRACGVLETIRISSLGYPTRRGIGEFVDRYMVLTHSSYWKEGLPELCDRILRHVVPGSEQYQVGKTKIFFRAGQLARLEQLLTEKVKRSIILIQRCMHGAMVRKRYETLRATTIYVQRMWKSKMELRRLREAKQQDSVLIIQRNWRGHRERKRYLQNRERIISSQAFIRGHLARTKYRTLQEETAAVNIQRVARGWMSRREYKKKLRSVVFIQSCLRRRLARKELQKLKVEARSASHHKEVSYKLENKVMELQRALSAQSAKTTQFSEANSALEMRLKSWKDKCKKLEGRNRELADRILSNAKEQQEALQFLLAEKTALEERGEALKGRIGGMDREVKRLTRELTVKQEELGKLQEERKWEGKKTPTRIGAPPMRSPSGRGILSPAGMVNPMSLPGASPTSPNPMHPGGSRIPRKRGSQETLSSGRGSGLSVSTNGTLHEEGSGAESEGSTDLPKRSPLIDNVGFPHSTRRLTESLVISSQSGTLPSDMERRGSAGGGFPGSMRYGSKAAMPPGSYGSFGRSNGMTEGDRAKRQTIASLDAVATVRGRLGYNAADGTVGSGVGKSRANRISYLMKPSTEMEKDKLASLLSSEGLIHEVVGGLIRNLTVPMPDLKIRFAAKEILFPSHMIGLCVAHMWSSNLTESLKNLLFSVLRALQGQVGQFDGDYMYAFWFSNTLELISILTTTEAKMSDLGEGGGHPGSPGLNGDIRRIIGEVKGDLRLLVGQICSQWLKDLTTRVNKLVIPGIVENQSLPGFICNDASGGFFNKLMLGASGAGGANAANVSIDAVLNFFTKLWKIINFYYLDEDIGRNIVLELLDVTGMTAFNHLLVRKNFCSWKRGMQIQYNVTRIEEWCKTHGIKQTTDNLERLMQAARLLQLQKKTSHDIDVIFEVCNLLNASQIKKIMQIYSLSEYENPIDPAVMKEISGRTLLATKDGKEASLFLSVRSRTDNLSFTLGRQATTVENYLPIWLELPKLRLVVTISP